MEHVFPIRRQEQHRPDGRRRLLLDREDQLGERVRERRARDRPFQDVHLGGDCALWIVSGSNMSGKSTLLRAVGINAVLAMAGAPVRAAALRMTELAERVMLSPSGLTRLVDQLVEEGLVQRERVPHDARVVLARLTDRGRQVLRRAARTHVRGIREHFTGKMSGAQLQEVASALETIVGRHEPH